MRPSRLEAAFSGMEDEIGIKMEFLEYPSRFRLLG